ncbi:Quinic acid utilization activator [Paramyrothecium foliicola]|nr:Quinic acid utilization activator [Paramyrothecium foliicola]
MSEALLGFLTYKIPGAIDLVERLVQGDELELRTRVESFQQSWRRSHAFASFTKLQAQFSLARPRDALTPTFSYDNDHNERVANFEATHIESAGNSTTCMEQRTHAVIATNKNPGILSSAVTETTEHAELRFQPQQNSIKPLSSGEGERIVSNSTPRVLTQAIQSRSEKYGSFDSQTALGPQSAAGSWTSIDDFWSVENAPKLMGTYFNTIHSSVPLLDKIGILPFVHSPPSRRSAKRQRLYTEYLTTSWLCCSLAAVYCDKTHKFLTRNSYNSIAQLLKSVKNDRQNNLERIQALLLLVLNLIRDNEWSSAREALLLVSDVAIQTRLFDLSDCANLNSKKKTWATCFLLDTVVACKLSILPSIRSQDCAVPAIEEDGWEEWDEWGFHGTRTITKSPARIASTFNALLQLMHMLNAYISSTTHYSTELSDISNTRITSSISSYHTLIKGLEDWAETLPGTLRNEMIWPLGQSGKKPFISVATSYIIELNIAFCSIVCFACEKVLDLDYFLDEHHKDKPLIQEVSCHYLGAFKCVRRLTQLYESTYGKPSMHPILNIMLQLIDWPFLSHSGGRQCAGKNNQGCCENPNHETKQNQVTKSQGLWKPASTREQSSINDSVTQLEATAFTKPKELASFIDRLHVEKEPGNSFGSPDHEELADQPDSPQEHHASFSKESSHKSARPVDPTSTQGAALPEPLCSVALVPEQDATVASRPLELVSDYSGDIDLDAMELENLLKDWTAGMIHEQAMTPLSPY